MTKLKRNWDSNNLGCIVWFWILSQSHTMLHITQMVVSTSFLTYSSYGITILWTICRAPSWPAIPITDTQVYKCPDKRPSCSRCHPPVSDLQGLKASIISRLGSTAWRLSVLCGQQLYICSAVGYRTASITLSRAGKAAKSRTRKFQGKTDRSCIIKLCLHW